MGKIKNFINTKIGRLTPIRYVGNNKFNRALWECKCDCGNITIVDSNCLTKRTTLSCGCLNHENHILRPNRITHGMCGTRIYRIWKRMKNRCYNANTNDYKKWYGSRGIKVCDEWKNSFETFYLWSIKHGRSEEHTSELQSQR